MTKFRSIALIALFAMVGFACKQATNDAQTQEEPTETAETVAEVDPGAMWEAEITPATIAEAGTAAEAGEEAVAFSIDTEKSSLQWHGKKLAYGHYGTINIAGGDLMAVNGNLAAGSVAVDVTSIACVDLAGDAEKKGKLEGHLKSDDFFGAESHPEASIVITEVVAGEAGMAMVSGNLTIKGITHQVTFPAKVGMDGNTMTASAMFSIDRSKWDVRFGSGSFFEDLGDKLIMDEIDLAIELVASMPQVESAG